MVRKLAFILLLLTTASLALADDSDTNLFCVVCGKGPLTGRIWISKWGPVCEDCYHLENHCSICGLPIGKDYVKTGDGRYICKFDRKNAVLDVDEAKEVFTDVRRDLIGLFGSTYALQYPDVTVSLFDVGYWSEAGRSDGLHKFGFASTRKTRSGDCTHEVVMLSGRLRTELSATAAHEYTHLWINENRPASHEIDPDTTEGICELCAYKLMESRGDTNEEEKILANPYTHGEIKKLVALEKEQSMPYILKWVKNGTTGTPEMESSTLAAPVRLPVMAFTNVAAPLPATLTLNGLMLNGRNRQAIISGVTFSEGESKSVPLRNQTLRARCVAIHGTNVVLKVEGMTNQVVLQMSEKEFSR
jgi:hypothetical protein